MKPFVIYPDKSYPRESVRPHFCYADGFLEDDLGAHMGEYGQSDYFHLSATFKRALDENDAVKEGTYSCQFNGRPATLFVVPTGGGHTEGLCCYDDDEESLRYIKEWLEDHNRLELFPTTPKMEDNWPKHCEIKSQINKKLISLNYTPTVAVDLYGHHANFTELQVRALQLIAIQKANEGEDAWQEFCANVVVYSRRWKKCAFRMHWRKDGRFVENFPEGFFDVSGRLHLQLIKEELKNK